MIEGGEKPPPLASLGSVQKETDKCAFERNNMRMESHLPPRILSAERLENAVIIGFDDGRSAVYSASLLYWMFSQAEDITDLDAEYLQAD